MPTDQLHQNIPNPFKEQTTINFELVSDSQVLLEITDAQGNLVATLVNGSMARGQHRVEWNASGQAPGTYYYSLYTDKELLTKRMIKL